MDRMWGILVPAAILETHVASHRRWLNPTADIEWLHYCLAVWFSMSLDNVRSWMFPDLNRLTLNFVALFLRRVEDLSFDWHIFYPLLNFFDWHILDDFLLIDLWDVFCLVLDRIVLDDLPLLRNVLHPGHLLILNNCFFIWDVLHP